MRVWFPIKRGVFRRTVGHVKAVDGVDFTVRRGHTVGIVGESGSGKTTLALALCEAHRVARGTIASTAATIQALGRGKLRPLRREIQIVFQDPFGSLSPRLSARQIVEEGLLVHNIGATRRGARQAGDRGAARRWASTPRAATATRMNSPGASASASPSRGRWS